MRIMRDDLPKTIADAYEAKLEEFGSPPLTVASRLFVVSAEAAVDGNPASGVTLPKVKKLVLESEQDIFGSVATSFVLLFDAAALTGVFVAWITLGGFAALMLFMAAVGLNIGFIGWCRRREQRRRYHPALLSAVLPLLNQTETEQVYVRALLQLTEKANLLGETSARSLLSQLKVLMESSEEITHQQKGIQAAMSGQSRTDVEAMRDNLARRVSQAQDSEARETLTQTLALSEARLQRAIALDPLGERLEAQQEMIRQTLSSVGESLAALALAPQTLTGPKLEMVQESLVTILNQTRAVEQAVQEVMALRAF